MLEVVLDIETKKSFDEVGGYKPEELGISFVGVYKRETTPPSVGAGNPEVGEFLSFWEKDFGRLWPLLEKADRIIGFNLRGFDFPALASYYSGNMSSLKMFDILDYVKEALDHRLSLDAIAKVTLGLQKSGSGLDALVYWQEGRFEELEKYCLDDVKITRDVYDYGMREGKLRYMDKWNNIKEFEVDFGYKKEDSGGVQMTLGI